MSMEVLATIVLLGSFIILLFIRIPVAYFLSQKDVLRYTLIVLGFTIIAAVFLGGLDYIFTTIIKTFVLK